MKRIVSILVSLGILIAIYYKIDFTAIWGVLTNCHPVWLATSLAMVVPITIATAWRLCCMMPANSVLGLWESNKLILVASTLNMVLPSKMGDIAKAYFMQQRGHLSGSLALSLVVFEKSCDMLSLLLWCVFGLAWIQLSGTAVLTDVLWPDWTSRLGVAPDTLFLALATFVVGGGLLFGILLIGSTRFARIFFGLAGKYSPGKIGGKLASLESAWMEMHGYFWSSKKKLTFVTTGSIFIWFLHLLQIWMFIIALREAAPFVANLALSPLAILAGLLPLTFAGVGTRDAALVFLYRGYFAPPAAAALGILCTARYFLPAIAGLPFLSQFMGAVKILREKRQTESPA